MSKYTERDSSEDDEEMLEGVAKWEYYDRQGRSVSPEEQDDESENSGSEGGNESELSEAPVLEDKPKKTPKSKARAPAKKAVASGKKARGVKKVYDMDLDDE